MLNSWVNSGLIEVDTRKYGYPGMPEKPESVEVRLDRLIAEIDKLQALEYLERKEAEVAALVALAEGDFAQFINKAIRAGWSRERVASEITIHKALCATI